MFEKLKSRMREWLHPVAEQDHRELFDMLLGADPALPAPDDEAFRSMPGMQGILERPVQVAVLQALTPEVRGQLQQALSLFRDMCDSDEAYALSDGTGRIAFLFFLDEIWEDQARDMLDALNRSLQEQWPKRSFVITIGDAVDAAEDNATPWRTSYRTATGLLDYRFVKPCGKIITYADIVARREIYPSSFRFRFDELKRHLEEPNVDSLTQWLGGAYSVFPAHDLHALGLCMHLTLEIVVNAISYCRERTGVEPVDVGEPEQLVGEVLSLTTPDELLQWILRFLVACRATCAQSER